MLYQKVHQEYVDDNHYYVYITDNSEIRERARRWFYLERSTSDQNDWIVTSNCTPATPVVFHSRSHWMEEDEFQQATFQARREPNMWFFERRWEDRAPVCCCCAQIIQPTALSVTSTDSGFMCRDCQLVR